MAEHGTTSRYNNDKCRCDECKNAQRLAHRAWRERVRNRPAEQIPHGAYGYTNYGCRCEKCCTDHTELKRADRNRRAQAARSA